MTRFTPAKILKSTARRFGSRVKFGVGVCYTVFIFCTAAAVNMGGLLTISPQYLEKYQDENNIIEISHFWLAALLILPAIHLCWQLKKFAAKNSITALGIFKSNLYFGLLLCVCLFLPVWIIDIVSGILHSPHS